MKSPVAGKTILVRLDLSDGLDEDAVKDIRDFATQGARVAIVAGYGDPHGEYNGALTLRSFVKPLSEMIGMPVAFVPDCVGSVAESSLDDVPFGSVAILENVRFHSLGHRHSRAFALRLSAMGDFFAVPGGVPQTAAVWIRELAERLPTPYEKTADSA